MSFHFTKSPIATLILAGAGYFAIGLNGQTPITDSLVVTFPNDVKVGSQVLKAGEYTIRQLGTSSSPRLLEFSTEKGTRIEASATAIAAIDNNNRNESSVILDNRNGEQHVHRIWIKGKTYGYEFPIDEGAAPTRAAANTGLRMTATYVPEAPAPTVAQNTPAPEPAPRAVAEEPAPAPAPTPAAEPAPAPAPAPAPEPAQAAAPAPDQAATQPQTPAMPATAIDWSILLLGGAGLFSAGLVMQTYRKNL